MSTPETRPFITLPADQPDYETLVDLTLAQRAELPGRFHTPVWLDATPGAFVCTVCWDDGEVTGLLFDGRDAEAEYDSDQLRVIVDGEDHPWHKYWDVFES